MGGTKKYQNIMYTVYTRLFGNNQSFYSFADFFVRFTTLNEQKVSLQEEKSNVSSRIRSAVYNVPSLEQSFFAAFRLALFPAVGKQNWTRLENKTPRDRNNEHEPKKKYELKGQL